MSLRPFAFIAACRLLAHVEGENIHAAMRVLEIAIQGRQDSYTR